MGSKGLRGAALGLCVATIGAPWIALDAAVPPLSVQQMVATGAMPKGVIRSPDGRSLYVANYGQFDRRNLGVYDASTLALQRTIDVPGIIVESAISPDGRYVATADYNASGVTIVDTSDWSARSIEVPLMNRASGIVFAATGLRVIVTGWFDDHLYAVGVATDAPALSFARRDVLRARRLRREYDSRSGENTER